MYQPKHFVLNDDPSIVEIMRGYPLATLVLGLSDGLSINHIPMLTTVTLGVPTALRCHVARANPVWQRVESASELAVVFCGVQSYISPNWYPSKQREGKVVPTWNYEAVHVSGQAVVHDDPIWLQQFLTDLTDTHEASQAKPWEVTDAPEPYVETMLRAVVGIEIRITDIQAKSKLGQNKEAADQLGMRAGLLAAETSTQLSPTDRAMRVAMADRVGDPSANDQS